MSADYYNLNSSAILHAMSLNAREFPEGRAKD